MLQVAQYVRMSTDHQRYSIENQSALIQEYAAAHDMAVVRTYADPGRSGLTLKDRPGLAQLLSDVVSARVPFSKILVYDVSRWGRFQDADESAHYEFMCRRAGVQVIYCAEPFSMDSTPLASVLKSLKRAMAGEYSRELSVKVAAGKARVAALGFRVGGIAGYGLRRRIVEDGHKPGVVLQNHQRKSLQTDRVDLVPGPPEEIALVRRIYREYVYLRKTEGKLCDELNLEGHTFFGRPWSRNLVRTVLTNEKYIGNSVFGRFSQRLRTPQVINPPEAWLRRSGAYEPIVSQELFQAAAVVRRWNRKAYVSKQDILESLRTLLRKHGKLTTELINASPGGPSANTVGLRFGSLCRAYEAAGYELPGRYRHHVEERFFRAKARETADDFTRLVIAAGCRATYDHAGRIHLENGTTVEVIACRPMRRSNGRIAWRLAYQRLLGATILVAVRFDPGSELRDVLAVPRSVMHSLPDWLTGEDDHLLSPYRYPDVLQAAEAVMRFVGSDQGLRSEVEAKRSRR